MGIAYRPRLSAAAAGGVGGINRDGSSEPGDSGSGSGTGGGAGSGSGNATGAGAASGSGDWDGGDDSDDDDNDIALVGSRYYTMSAHQEEFIAQKLSSAKTH